MLSVMPAARKLVGSWTRLMVIVPPWLAASLAPGSWVASGADDELEAPPPPPPPPQAASIRVPTPRMPNSWCLRVGFMYTSWSSLATAGSRSTGLHRPRRGRGDRPAAPFCEALLRNASPVRVISADYLPRLPLFRERG